MKQQLRLPSGALRIMNHDTNIEISEMGRIGFVNLATNISLLCGYKKYEKYFRQSCAKITCRYHNYTQQSIYYSNLYPTENIICRPIPTVPFGNKEFILVVAA